MGFLDIPVSPSDIAGKVDKGSLVINVLDYGAVGDWNGTAGSDNLSAFNKAAAAAKASSSAATIYIPAGDYRLSDNWLLDGEQITVECDQRAVIRTTVATTTGATVTFMGNGVQSPSNSVTTPQRERFTWRGGKIVASGSGTTDNALGVVRVENCHVSGVILDADRKALTAQYGVDNIVWERIVVTRAGGDAVTIETGCHRAALRDIHVVNATGTAILVTSGDAGARCSDVLLDNIAVDSSSTGVSIGLTDRLSIRKTFVAAASTQGLYVAETTRLSISPDSAFPSINFGSNVTRKRPAKVAISLVNGWLSFGTPYDTPGARLTGDGMVVLVGAIKSGTSTAGTKLATLPTGYWPEFRHRVTAVNAGGTPADLYVDPDGGIYTVGAIGTTLISFDGITFPAK